MAKQAKPAAHKAETSAYRFPEADSPLRPEIGTQAQFRKRKKPVTYRYDSSLAPSLNWDGQNPAREQGEFLLRAIGDASALAAPHQLDIPREFRSADGRIICTVRGLADAVAQLRALSAPFLDWSGKAERLSFDVPTLPLFVHERLSTKAIIETLKSHTKKENSDQASMFDLFGDPARPVRDQVLKAYEYRDQWVNRMILGDSLVVMNSLLHYENLGGQVQMMYIDPPYGVKFGSNFQPFIREPGVGHNNDVDMTREPEMVKAYRDTWELGLHSYLTYLRDRLLLARELLNSSGSIFVQIGDENVHHVRELMDATFGSENYLNIIPFTKTSGVTTKYLASNVDFLLWFAKDRSNTKFRQLYISKERQSGTAHNYNWLRLPDGTSRGMTKAEKIGISPIPEDARIYKPDNITSQGNPVVEFFYRGNSYKKPWKTNLSGLENLASSGRLHIASNSLQYVRYLDDFPCIPVTQLWDDMQTGNFTEHKIYSVQTAEKVLERCILMTTDPGDLVLDPTCGSGTTAYVAEQWGRRWITIDTSRVPLALTRQRILSATYPYYELKDEVRGPAGGFIYKRKQNRKGDEIGGIVPHVTLKSIANDEPPGEEVLVDRPEETASIIRVAGPFCFEATIPTPMDWDETDAPDAQPEAYGDFLARMLETLRRSPVLHLAQGHTVTLKNIRPPAKSLYLSAEAVSGNGNGNEKSVALIFGPENGAVSERLVFDSAKEAYAKNFAHLYVIGFAIQANARQLIEDAESIVGIPATYVQATPDLMMSDLLKTMRSSQIFSVCGLPEIEVIAAPPGEDGRPRKQVRLLGLDVFDPATMETIHRSGSDVPCWMLDTDYNGLVFHACQVFFPRTAAWDNLKKALKATHEESLWDHLAGTESAPFEFGEQKQIAVKVIDDRGNELMVVENLLGGK